MRQAVSTCDLKSCFLCQQSLRHWLPAIEAHKTSIKIKKGQSVFKEGDSVK